MAELGLPRKAASGCLVDLIDHDCCWVVRRYWESDSIPVPSFLPSFLPSYLDQTTSHRLAFLPGSSISDRLLPEHT
jgi:hypothetical protein